MPPNARNAMVVLRHLDHEFESIARVLVLRTRMQPSTNRRMYRLLSKGEIGDLFHQFFMVSRAFVHALRRERFGPSARSLWSFTPPSSLKASRSWLFCRV